MLLARYGNPKQPEGSCNATCKVRITNSRFILAKEGYVICSYYWLAWRCDLCLIMPHVEVLYLKNLNIFAMSTQAPAVNGEKN